MPRASLPTLPNEMLLDICSYLCRHCSGTRTWPSPGRRLQSEVPLASLSMACRRLRDVAQPVLYHDVQPLELLPFLRTIIARPDLAAQVRGFSNAHTVNDTASGEDLRIFRKKAETLGVVLRDRYMRFIMECRIDRGQWLLELALGCLPNAEAFSISLRAGDECDLGRLFEGSLQIESVKRLYLYRLVGEDHPINMDQLDSFLAMVPRVEQLEMNVSGRLRQNLPLAEVRSLIVAENSLTRLGLEKLVSSCPKLERFEYRSASLDTRIRWQRGREEVTWREAQSLLHQRRETLKHLDFDFGEDYLSFRDDELQPWDYLDSFREFDRLETLLVRTAGFGEEGDGEQEPAFPASAEHLVEMLPQSLTVLGFCGEHRKWDGVGRLAQAIRQGNFQKLKRVLLEIVDDFEGSREILRTVGVVAKRYDGRYQTFSYYSHDWL